MDDPRNLASRLADDAGMTGLVIQTAAFTLQGYFRFAPSQTDRSVVVYIEGDGHAWDGQVPSSNPTPIDPLALRLAAEDTSRNVLYLARPCQYVENVCEVKYWTSHRMATEVITSYTQALDQIQQRHGITQFRLVGFSGGGGIATLVAARLQHNHPNSVTDLRTIAGNIDHQRWTRSLRLSPLTGSLNPADYAEKLSNLPQIHFIGKEDPVVSAEIYNSYEAKLIDKSCSQGLSQPASHVRGWTALWQSLQHITPFCDDNQRLTPEA